MDSIFRHYPIGICLDWNANHVKTMQIRPNSKTIIPPLRMKNNKAELIIVKGDVHKNITCQKD